MCEKKLLLTDILSELERQVRRVESDTASIAAVLGKLIERATEQERARKTVELE